MDQLLHFLDSDDESEIDFNRESEESTSTDMYNGGGGGGGGGYDYDQPQQPSQNSRVKVEDALTYLDQVKTQFANEPHVYTQFLDIMKDFKSQAIDTPGVIMRVSSLFAGKPHLITGFNQFLPAGFEVVIDEDRIIISEPSGLRKLIQNGEVINIPAVTYHNYMELISQPGVSSDEDEEEGEAQEEAGDEEEEQKDEEEEEEVDEEEVGEEEEVEDEAGNEAEDEEEQEDEILDEATTSEEESLEETDDEGEVEEQPATTVTQKVPILFQISPSQYSQVHAVSQSLTFVNKIRSRFRDDHVFPLFLDILAQNYTTINYDENCIMEAVTALFGEEKDILEEFRMFLPSIQRIREEAGEQPDEQMIGYVGGMRMGEEPVEDEEMEDEATEADQELEDKYRRMVVKETESSSDEEEDEDEAERIVAEHHRRGFPMNRIQKESKEFMQVATIDDFQFFEKVRRLVSPSEFDTFMRSISLYNQGIVSPHELLQLLNPIIGGYPDLLNEMNKNYLSQDDAVVPAAMEQLTEEQQYNIDYASCKQLGVSYRSLPENVNPLHCTGRTLLCKSVLNDTWVSFPSWSSEDTTVVSSKKTPFEEFVCKTEDERFELDIIIEVNKYAIEALEAVRRRLCKMSTLEQEKYKLDEKLGGTSATLMGRAVRRIYGEHAAKIIEGLKKNPALTVPKVIERMREKEKDWIEAQEQMNKVWREQNDRYAIKALDHQSNSVKTNDAKWIKAKQIVHQLETLFDERQTKYVEGQSDDEGPHLTLQYPEDKALLHDVQQLIIHHVNRQSISQHEKDRIIYVLKNYLAEWFFLPQTESSSYSEEEDDDEDDHSYIGLGRENYDEDEKLGGTTRMRLIYGGNPLLVFLRVHHIMCERLNKIKKNWHEITEGFIIEEDLQELRKKVYEEQGKEACLTHELNISDMNNGLPELRSSGEKKKNPLTLYTEFLDECKGYLDGSVEANAFEDQIRVLFPLNAHLLFSVDKMVGLATRQLQQLALSTDNAECLKMYDHYKVNPPFSVYDRSDRRHGIEQEYGNEAETRLNCQNCFKVCTMDEEQVRMTIELVDTETEEMSLNGDAIERAMSEAGTSDEDEDEEEEMEGEDETEQDVTMEEEPSTAAAPSPRPGMVIREKKKPEEPVKKALYLKRNMKFRLSTGISMTDFTHFSGTFSVTSDKIRMANDAVEGFVYNERPIGTVLRNRRAKIVTTRRKRFYPRYQLESSKETWLDEGCTKIPCNHPYYPFLLYHQYHMNDQFD